MSFPPAILHLQVVRPSRRAVRLWLPLFLLWPLALALGLLALVGAALTDVFLALLGRSYHRYTLLLVRLFVLVGQTHGLVIRIDRPNETVNLTVH